MATKRNGKDTKVIPDGHPRRLADGRNAWRKQNAEQRKQFVAWLQYEGLTEALQDAGYLGREDNRAGCLDFYTVPPSDDPHRPTEALDG
jgi:hypothetical protein